jgi:hypothetical protein
MLKCNRKKYIFFFLYYKNDRYTLMFLIFALLFQWIIVYIGKYVTYIVVTCGIIRYIYKLQEKYILNYVKNSLAS